MSFDYKRQSNEFYKNKLNSDAFEVCRREATERPGSGAYDKFYEKGTYYCAGCGGDYPLFKSDTKFDSGTGWPSFWDPINKDHIILTPESSKIGWGMRIEVSCGRCGSHLGHVFEDGPRTHTGKRYCMNSVALIFIPEGKAPKRTYEIEDQVSRSEP